MKLRWGKWMRYWFLRPIYNPVHPSCSKALRWTLVQSRHCRKVDALKQTPLHLRYLCMLFISHCPWFLSAAEGHCSCTRQAWWISPRSDSIYAGFVWRNCDAKPCQLYNWIWSEKASCYKWHCFRQVSAFLNCALELAELFPRIHNLQRLFVLAYFSGTNTEACL